MCGRYLLTSPPEAVRQLFGHVERMDYPPRHNIAPTQPILVVRAERGERHAVLVRWGLIPPWAKDPRDLPTLINARAETAAEKPAFRAAFRRRRCVIPATGWYEWQSVGAAPKGPKRPFAIGARGGGLLVFAGLWEHYLAPDGSEIETAAILTVDANAALSGVHDRMPVLLAPDAIGAWLAEDAEPAALARLLRPAPDDWVEAWEVAPLMNSVRNDGPELVVPVKAKAATPKPAPPPKHQMDLF